MKREDVQEKAMKVEMTIPALPLSPYLFSSKSVLVCDLAADTSIVNNNCDEKSSQDRFISNKKVGQNKTGPKGGPRDSNDLRKLSYHSWLKDLKEVKVSNCCLIYSTLSGQVQFIS